MLSKQTAAHYHLLQAMTDYNHHVGRPLTSLVTEVGNFVWKTDAAHRLAVRS